LRWKEGIDLQIEYRWPGNPPDRLRADAAEIVSLNPDVIGQQRAGFGIHVGANTNHSDYFANVTFGGLA
jgi:hypothetical protein